MLKKSSNSSEKLSICKAYRAMLIQFNKDFVTLYYPYCWYTTPAIVLPVTTFSYDHLEQSSQIKLEK